MSNPENQVDIGQNGLGGDHMLNYGEIGNQMPPHNLNSE